MYLTSSKIYGYVKLIPCVISLCRILMVLIYLFIYLFIYVFLEPNFFCWRVELYAFSWDRISIMYLFF
jgi:hypothetical protein